MENKECEFDTTKLVQMYLKADFVGRIPDELDDGESSSLCTQMMYGARDDWLRPFRDDETFSAFCFGGEYDSPEHVAFVKEVTAELSAGLSLPNNMAEIAKRLHELALQGEDGEYPQEWRELRNELLNKYDGDEFLRRGEKLISDVEDAIMEECSKANDRYHELYDDDIQEEFRQEEALMEEQEKREYEDFLERQKHNPNLQL